jgi:hypothetical protein
MNICLFWRFILSMTSQHACDIWYLIRPLDLSKKKIMKCLAQILRLNFVMDRFHETYVPDPQYNIVKKNVKIIFWLYIYDLISYSIYE